MKKLLLLLSLLLPSVLYAQLNGTGYYRVENNKTGRYIVLVDNRASLTITPSTQDVDLEALRLIGPFEDRVASNPATICKLTVVSKTSSTTYKCNVSGQSLDLYNLVKSYLEFSNNTSDGTYAIGGSATKGGVTMVKYLTDTGLIEDEVQIFTRGDKASEYAYWRLHPINDKYYFGFKPEFKASLDGADSLYYAPMYASFPFAITSNVKAYYITEVKNGYAKVHEFAYTVPDATPVFVECKGAKASDNKVTLTESTASAPGNKLKGVYYCNDVKEVTGHRNVTAYNPSTMRILGRAADGRLAFIKSSTLKYIPANTSYLEVAAGSPDVIYVVKDYPSGIETLTASDVKSQQRGVYSLSGQRFGDTTEGLHKGIYIVNGRKVVMK